MTKPRKQSRNVLSEPATPTAATAPAAPVGGTGIPAVAAAIVEACVAAGIVAIDDVAAARTLVGLSARDGHAPPVDPRCWIAMCLALRAPRDGHTCVVLERIAAEIADTRAERHGDRLVASRAAGEADPCRLAWPASRMEWKTLLAEAGPLVGDPGDRAPFIIDGGRLYLARSLDEEEQIARRLVGADGARVEILLGGPGTGKTTEVAKRLVDKLAAAPATRLLLAAPTGKAAARMAEALRQRLHDPTAPENVRNVPPSVRAAIEQAVPVTVHRLLGARPRGPMRYRHDAATPLDCELVVVDEASMLSSSLMCHLLAAIGPRTELLLVGDPHQLASVDAGTVLGDIAAAAGAGTRLAGRTRTLTVRHRFGPRIGALADAILAGDAGVPRAFDVLEGRWSPAPAETRPASRADSVTWVQPGTPAFAALEEDVVAHARELCRLAAADDVAAAIDHQRRLQVLCANRSGPAGVSGWNTLVERRLGVGGGSAWYAGRPVLVARNNMALRLSNGDVGLVVPTDDQDRMDAAFPAAGGPRRVPVSRLEEIETVHALTIHKSQGSEYGHAIVVLPRDPGRILTRELLYTGVTRAREKVTVVGSRDVIEAAIRRPIRRATGLEERLR